MLYCKYQYYYYFMAQNVFKEMKVLSTSSIIIAGKA